MCLLVYVYENVQPNFSQGYKIRSNVVSFGEAKGKAYNEHMAQVTTSMLFLCSKLTGDIRYICLCSMLMVVIVLQQFTLHRHHLPSTQTSSQFFFFSFVLFRFEHIHLVKYFNFECTSEWRRMTKVLVFLYILAPAHSRLFADGQLLNFK